jgi:hypothetical protein
MSEQTITNNIIAWLREQSCYVIKIHGGPLQERGLPDIIFCSAGRFGAVEVKVLGKRATVLQQYHLDHIIAAGGTAFVAHSLEEAQKILDDSGFLSW